MAKVAYTVHDGSVNLKGPDGETYSLPEAEARKVLAAGDAVPLSEAERTQILEAREYDAPVTAGLLGVANTALFGLPSLLAKDTVGKYAKHNPTAFPIGEIGGALGSMLIPGAPLARVSAAGRGLGQRIAARATAAERAAAAARSRGFTAPATGTASKTLTNAGRLEVPRVVQAPLRAPLGVPSRAAGPTVLSPKIGGEDILRRAAVLRSKPAWSAPPVTGKVTGGPAAQRAARPQVGSGKLSPGRAPDGVGPPLPPPTVDPALVQATMLSRRARAAELLLPRATAAAAEAGALGATQAVTDQAIKGKDFDPVEVASRAAFSATFGAATSLLGAGLSYGASRARGALLARANVSPKMVDALHARTGALTSDLAAARAALGPKAALLDKAESAVVNGRYTTANEAAKAVKDALGADWLGASRVPAYALQGQIAAAKAGLAEVRQKTANAFASSMSKVRAGLALGGYVSSDSILLGFGLYNVGKVFQSKIGQRVVGALGSSAKTVARFSGSSRGLAAATISGWAMEGWREQLANTDPGEVAQDAMRGYVAGGLDQNLSRDLADFQATRVQMLKEALPVRDTPEGRARFSRLLQALDVPKSIIKRIKKDVMTPEDRDVLRTAFPRAWALMVAAAKQELKNPKLKPESRMRWEKIADFDQAQRRAASIRLAAYGPAPGPPSRQSPTGTGATDGLATPMQRLGAQGPGGGR